MNLEKLQTLASIIVLTNPPPEKDSKYYYLYSRYKCGHKLDSSELSILLNIYRPLRVSTYNYTPRIV